MKINLKIEGTSPLLYSHSGYCLRCHGQQRHPTKRGEAEHHLCKHGGRIVVPSCDIKRRFIRAVEDHVKVPPELRKGFTFEKPFYNLTPQRWVVKTFWTRITNRRGTTTVRTHRPLFPKWNLTLGAMVDVERVSADFFARMAYVTAEHGLGSWCGKHGRYGRFNVASIECNG